MDVDPEVQSLIDTLSASEDPNKSAQGFELGALSAIYPNVRLHHPSPSRPGTPASSSSGSDRVRFVVTLQPEDGTTPEIEVLVSLPEDYPEYAPTLQLLGKYVGSYAVDAGLWEASAASAGRGLEEVSDSSVLRTKLMTVGNVTRTYLTSAGVPFTPGQECIFDGLVHVQSLVESWYSDHLAIDAAGEAARSTPRASPPPSQPAPSTSAQTVNDISTGFSKLNFSASQAPAKPLPEIYTSEAITDRKSAFVGHCARISAEADVAAIVAHLLEDKKIARAAHPTIWAYRLARDTGGPAGIVTEGDYDDDGETQAGSRLKHLLEILDVRDTVVVVTRWFGGIHLGPDRFKHINQAARDAMELAGVLEETGGKKDKRRR
ncbi:regulation of amino acid metabolism-related protein [Trichosporon asahii var. asahii CBS 2479]|uniref:Regulation of amino acid metabolism-related protein n=1 Tax=Trichosporon asahii var. asahii (strain ATCC 90039 / CBS 2479 / JCM 2466 / KCTC 7840 / NBRC 103889/ NCYC 2677 / UAMH 7654) TaxID=1186058 RepID=J5SUW4_TRIAS|nr:regulation of amino acid metabolism-related protein [Trichosporon asahii var. asahii CBS 2479]EJT47656.1 regulation of amino acid metabolism-related protein [Trichosporon asahii var. asahii CBS 2479]